MSRSLFIPDGIDRFDLDSPIGREQPSEYTAGYDDK